MHKYSARSDKDKFLRDKPVTGYDIKREKNILNIEKELSALKKIYAEVLVDITKINFMLTTYELFKPLNHRELNSKIDAKKITEDSFDRHIKYLLRETFLSKNILKTGLVDSLIKIRNISIKTYYKSIEQNTALDIDEIYYQEGFKKLPKKKSSVSKKLYGLADELYKIAAKEDSDSYFDEEQLPDLVNSNNVNLNPQLAARKIKTYNKLAAEFKIQFRNLIRGLKNLDAVIIQLDNINLDDTTWKAGSEAIEDINNFINSQAKDILLKMCNIYREFIFDRVHEKEALAKFRKDNRKQRTTFRRQKEDVLKQVEKSNKSFSRLFNNKGK